MRKETGEGGKTERKRENEQCTVGENEENLTKRKNKSCEISR